MFVFNTTDLGIDRPLATIIFAHYGALVGGITGALFSLAGIFLLIFNLQYQEHSFRRQRIEGRFFDLLKIHRENSAAVAIKDRTGKKIFLSMLREFYLSLACVQDLRSAHELRDDEVINIAYLAFYYGASGPASEEILRKRLDAKHGPGFVNDLVNTVKSRLAAAQVDDEFDYVPLQGHQVRLGHYFRHFFQSVTYINNQPTELLSYRDKYEYIKTLRAQLSTQEQVLLFLNSLSDLGLPWERSNTIRDPNGRLITKYNLVKNIPDGYVRGVDVRRFYPDVAYEGSSTPDARPQLEATYR